jgi:thioredoxin reductase
VRTLVAAGVGVHRAEVTGVAEHEGAVEVVTEGGEPIVRDALFIQPTLTLATDLAIALGADLTDSGSVAVDATGQTSVSGLYVAGDAGATVQSVAVAAGSGARAAYAINASLRTGLEQASV